MNEESPSATGLVLREFATRFRGEPLFIARAPGRVNVIGEHTDYNDGFVLPLAIEPAVWVAVRPRADRVVRAWSVEFKDGVEFDLAELSPGRIERHVWSEYVKGVGWALREAGLELRGWDGTIHGDVPIGAGLSSSAAIQMAVARAFADASELTWDPKTMARIAQRAENEWIGVQCGIMDQLASAAGEREHALLIDCRTLDLRTIRLPEELRVVVLDTATRRELTSSAYNERRRECDAAARAYGVRSLRDLTTSQLASRPSGLGETEFRRARHVVSENARVIEMAAALPAGDQACISRLMDESHRSLRDDFEVSSPPLDAIVAAAQRAGSVGARMTGAGFGGCAVAFVTAPRARAFVADTLDDYERSTGISGHAYVWRASDGARSRPWVPRAR